MDIDIAIFDDNNIIIVSKSKY